jgi:hypothetical protein
LLRQRRGSEGKREAAALGVKGERERATTAGVLRKRASGVRSLR